MKSHYTYMITNNLTNRYYIGVRSCNGLPEDDVAYWSSSTSLKKEITKNGQSNYTKIVLSQWTHRVDAMSHEILLHDCFNVPRNPMCYNRARQTSTGFDRTGTVESEETRKRKSLAHTGTTLGKPSILKGVPRPNCGRPGRVSPRKGNTYGKKGLPASEKLVAAMLLMRGQPKAHRGQPKPKDVCPHCNKSIGHHIIDVHIRKCLHNKDAVPTVMVNHKTYPSIGAAIEDLKIDKSTVYKRLKLGIPGYQYL